MVVHSHSFLLLRNLLLSNLWLSSFPFKKEEKKVELIQRSRGNPILNCTAAGSLLGLTLRRR
jgi:hypothetical protein